MDSDDFLPFGVLKNQGRLVGRPAPFTNGDRTLNSHHRGRQDPFAS